MVSTTPPTGNLKRRMMQASGWNVARVVGMQGLRLASNLIMTRLLLPEAFGLMALVASLLTAFQLFTDVGIGRSVSRDPDGDQPHYLRVAWTVKLLRACIVASAVLLAALALWLIAPHVAPEGTVYADPRLPGLVALSALVPIFRGASSTNGALASRQLRNRMLTVIGISGQASGVIMQVILASIWPTVWALMAGFLTMSFVRLILTHTVLEGPRMRLEWDREIADRLWSFGKYIMGSSVLGFFARMSDRFLLAALLGASSFGLYTIAQVWLEAGRTLFNSLSGSVGFPAISEVMRTRPHELVRLFKKYMRVVDLLCVVGFVGYFLLGQVLINLLYTETYATSGQYLRLMGLSFLAMRFDIISQLLMNLGNSRAIMLMTGIQAGAMCVFLPLGYYTLGVEGAVMAVVLSPLSAAPYGLALLRPTLGSDWARSQYIWLAAIALIAVAVYLVH